MKDRKPFIACSLFVLLLVGCVSKRTGDREISSSGMWDMSVLAEMPRYENAEGFDESGVRALFFEGLPWKEKPTRVFAWYGVPENAQAGEKLPAMVLVHGGGGTAFAEWVRLWTARGYAAIAMDTCGAVPRGTYGNWDRHEQGGPPGWGGFDQGAWAVEDQWSYHAVADAILAHSLIRSFPEIDSERTGITGISWGGYLTCIVAGVDHRFRFAAPVYGCGNYDMSPTWKKAFARMDERRIIHWMARWDPSNYLPYAPMPFLWVTGTNDFAYPLDALQKSYRRPKNERTLCVRPRMAHAHGGPGENPEEIHAFANHYLKDGPPLPRFTKQRRRGNTLQAKFQSEYSMTAAELLYTKETGEWNERLWETASADLNPRKQTVSAVIPENAVAGYFNLIDEQGRVVSSEHVGFGGGG